MIMDAILDLDIRRKIFQLLSKNPGLYFREISRRLNIPKSTLDYHLNFLLKRELLTSKSEKNFIRFYVKDNVGKNDKELIAFLRNITSRYILLHFLSAAVTTQADIAKELEISSQAVEFHIKRLLKMGIIEPAPYKDGKFDPGRKYTKVIFRELKGREKVYRLKYPNASKIADLLVCYEESLTDDITKNILEFFGKVNPNRVGPKKITTYKNIIRKAEDKIFDIFPHPYHA